jgi:hypothetical protein
MGNLWRVDKALEHAEGLRWIREWLGVYDFSKVDWITVRRGRSERYAFRAYVSRLRRGTGTGSTAA